MSREKIKISNFNMFCDIMKYLKTMSDGVKVTVGEMGMSVCARNNFSKCELTSNSIVSEGEITFCIGDLSKFNKILNTVRDTHLGFGYDTLSMYFDSPFVLFESRKIKTKFATVEEDKIANFIGTKLHTKITPQMEFKTNSAILRKIQGHSTLFDSTSEPRVYLTADSDMENNVIYAKLGKEDNDLENSLTLELGLITSGSLGDRRVVLDFERLNILNMIPSDNINAWIAAEEPVLVSTTRQEGEHDTFLNLNIYSFMMVK